MQSKILILILSCCGTYSPLLSAEIQNRPSNFKPNETARIAAASKKQLAIFSETFQQLEKMGAIVVNYKELELPPPARLSSYPKVHLQAKESLKNELLRQMASRIIGEIIDPLRVSDFYDLSETNLPDDLKSIRTYFQKEYQSDVSAVRLLISDGLPKGILGRFLVFPKAGTKERVSAPLRVGKKVVQVSGVLEISNMKELALGTIEKILGARECILVNAALFDRFRPGSLSVIAHELRHLLDSRLELQTQSNFHMERARWAREYEAKRESFEAQERKEALASETFKDFVEAKKQLSLRLDPSLKDRKEFQHALQQFENQLVDVAIHSVRGAYAEWQSEDERRGHLEAARFAKSVQKWSREKYLQSFLIEAPAVSMYTEAQLAPLRVTLPSGKQVLLAIYPPSPWIVKWQSDLFK